LHRNRGDGTFEPVVYIDGGGVAETAIAAGDANGDGFADLWVANFTSSTVVVLQNDGRGAFTPISWANVGARPWMIALGDVDGDGDLDAATSDSAANQVSIVRGNGFGSIGGVTSVAVGSFPLAIDLGDLDGDGDLDLVASNYAAATFTLWRNAGDGTFSGRQDLPASSAGSCAVLVDDDRDGDLDLIGVDEVDDVLLFYRQIDASSSGVQPRSCAATLRIDGQAQSHGYGGVPPLEIAMGRAHFLSLTGTPGAACAIFAGFPSAAGLLTPFGSWHLDLASTSLLVSSVLDGDGELYVRFDVPPVPARTLPVGLQALVVGSALPVLSNPEQVLVDR
jgi:hypothetical protein